MQKTRVNFCSFGTWLLLSICLLTSATASAITPEQLDQLKVLKRKDRQRVIELTDSYLAQPLTDRERLGVGIHRCHALIDLSLYDQIEQLYQQLSPIADHPSFAAQQMRLAACYGSSQERQGNTSKALELFSQYLEKYQDTAIPYAKAEMLYAKSITHSYRGEYAQALSDLNRGMEFYIASGVEDMSLTMQMRNAMGNNYNYLELHDKAIENYQEVEQWLAKTGDSLGQSILAFNIANIYNKEKQYEKTREWAERSSLLALKSDDAIGVAYAKVLIGTSLSFQQRYQQALDATQDLEQVFDKYKERDGAASLRIKKAQWHLALDNFQQAIEYANQAQALYNDSDILKGQAEVADVLAEIYTKQQQYALALAQRDQQIEFNQKLYNTEVNEEIAKLEAEFQLNLDSKEKQILQYQNEAQQAELATIKSRRLLLLMLFLTLLFSIGMLALLLWRSKKLSEQMQHSANHDVLTDLPNRRYMMTRLNSELSRYQRTYQAFSVVLFDIDHFKQVNDRFGHQRGDEVLKQVAKVINNSIREFDISARIGGEEFLLLLPQTNSEQAGIIAERIRCSIAEIDHPVVGNITISAGYANYQGDGDSDELLHAADSALYKAKANGRNCVVAAKEEENA